MLAAVFCLSLLPSAVLGAATGYTVTIQHNIPIDFISSDQKQIGGDITGEGTFEIDDTSASYYRLNDYWGDFYNTGHILEQIKIEGNGETQTVEIPNTAPSGRQQININNELGVTNTLVQMIPKPGTSGGMVGVLLNRSVPTSNIVITFVWATEETPEYDVTVAVAPGHESYGSVPENTGVVFMRNTEDGTGSTYTITAEPNAGYVFDHWEYRESADGETWDDDAWAAHTTLTEESGTVTVTADTQFRAHFRLTEITKYESEAYLWAYDYSWVGQEIPDWYYEDYSLYRVREFLPDEDVAHDYYDCTSPAYVGERAYLALPIVSVDGDLKTEPIPGNEYGTEGAAFDYALYMGDTGEPVLSDTVYLADNGSIMEDGGVIRFKFYIQSMPKVDTCRLVVKMKDAEDTEHTVEQSYDLEPYDDSGDYEDPITVTMSVEKLTVDGKYVVEPQQFVIDNGWNAARALSSFLRSEGIGMESSGSLTSSFYLSAVRDYDQPDTWLREKAYGEYSGWMYSVNNYYPNVGASDRVLLEDDVIRWQYTCAETMDEIGADLGVTDYDSTFSGYAAVDMTQLMAKVAQIRADGTAGDHGTNYDAAVTVLKDLDATQDEVDAALSALTGGVVTANKGALKNAISEAASLKNAADIGDASGRYPQSAYDAFVAAIDAAREVNSDASAAQITVDLAVTALTEATGTFANSKNFFTSAQYSDVRTNALAYLAASVTDPDVASVGGEWAVIALARGGEITGDIRSNYLQNLKEFITTDTGVQIDTSASPKQVTLNSDKPTENERVVLALTSLGLDASDWEGYDFVTPLTDTTWVNGQGINSTIFALIALDSKPYTCDDSVRTALIDTILSGRNTDENYWGLNAGDTGFYADITGMALQALAPYKDDAAYASTIADCVGALESYYSSRGCLCASGESSESYAQIIVALAAYGVDANDGGYVVDGVSLLDMFLQYARSDSMFQHVLTGGGNRMATEQAAYALVAYNRYAGGENTLYDMSDLLSDAGVIGIKVGGTSATEGADNTWAATLPYGSAIPAESSAVVITTSSAAATVGSLQTADDGATWTFTVTSEDGTATADYTLNVSVSTDAPIATVSFHLNGGTAAGLAAGAAKTYYQSNDGNSLPVPRKTNCTFEGWYDKKGTSGTRYTTISSALPSDLYARWTFNGSGSTITVSFRLIGSTLSSNDIDLEYSDDYKDAEYVTWIPTTTYRIEEGSTVYDLFTEALSNARLKSVGAGNNYVETIYAPAVCGGYKLSELTNGKYSGWMYTVNDVHVAYGLLEQTLYDGDIVIWHYVDDYRYEVEDWFDDLEYPSLAEDDTYYNKWLEAADVNLPPAEAGNDPGTIEPGTTVTNGNASANVNKSNIDEILDTAEEDGITTIKINAKTDDDVTKSTVTLPTGSTTDIAGAGLDLTVETATGTFDIDNSALQTIAGAGSGDVTLTAEELDAGGLSDANQALVGDHPVFDLGITVGGSAVTDFGDGTVTVSLPYTPADGEEPANLTVYYIDGDGNAVEMTGAVYDEETGMIVFETDHFSVFAVVYEDWTNPFSDVSTDDWFYDEVKFVATNGLFNGTGDTVFAPDMTMTRAMFATVLYRLEGEPAVTAENPFDDVEDGEWYTDAVIWANNNGIVEGYGEGIFGTNDDVTREQMAKMLYSYADYKGYDTTAAADLAAYTDADEISDWALAAMRWANAEEVITGRTATTLVPLGDATRAEVATIFMRFMED